MNSKNLNKLSARFLRLRRCLPVAKNTSCSTTLGVGTLTSSGYLPVANQALGKTQTTSTGLEVEHAEGGHNEAVG